MVGVAEPVAPESAAAADEWAPVSPIGTPFPVQKPGPTWHDERTGTSFLPAEAVERAAAGNPIEKAKLEKDATSAFTSVYE